MLENTTYSPHIFKNIFLASLKTQCVSITKTNSLMCVTNNLNTAHRLRPKKTHDIP